MVHCVGNSKHVVRSQATSLLSKCRIVGEAVEDKVLDIPAPTTETEHQFILLWNDSEHSDSLFHEMYDGEDQNQCLQKYQSFQNGENAAVYELGRGVTHSVGRHGAIWSTACTGWIWLYFIPKLSFRPKYVLRAKIKFLPVFI